MFTISLVDFLGGLNANNLSRFLGLICGLLYGGEWGFPLVPWDVCTMPMGEGGLCLIDVAT